MLSPLLFLSILLSAGLATAALGPRRVAPLLKAVCGVLATAGLSGSYLLWQGERTPSSGQTVTLPLVSQSDWSEVAAEPTYSQAFHPAQRAAQPLHQDAAFSAGSSRQQTCGGAAARTVPDGALPGVRGCTRPVEPIS